MQTNLISLIRRNLRIVFLYAVASLFSVSVLHAGITFNLTVTPGYYEAWGTTTNSTGPNAPFGGYLFVSPGYPTNYQSSAGFTYDTNGWNLLFNGSSGATFLPDFNSLMSSITNGPWTLFYTNAVTTNVTVYHFTVSAPTVTSNIFPAVSIIFPTNNDFDLTTQNPTFVWSGPTNYNSMNVAVNNSANFNQGANLPATQTSWQSPVPIPYGTNNFSINYSIIYTNSLFIASIPRDGSSNAISEWDSTVQLYPGANSQFAIPAPLSTVIGFTNIAHYTFDNSSNPGLDASTNHNDIDTYSYWGPLDAFTTTSEAGGGARQFFGGDARRVLYNVQTLNAWSNTFSGSFSVSLWLQTSTTVGNDGDDMSDYTGQAIAFMDDNGVGTIPVAITGSKVALYTGDPDGNQDTLHSQTSVTTGSYVHVVVTRDASNGEKDIYVNGVLDATDYASTEMLMPNFNGFATIGGWSGTPYTGLVDDVQFYSGILRSNDISFLYNNPGNVAVNQDFNSALGTTNLVWTTGGDVPWFTETTNVYNGPSAAQSGVVTGSQISVLQTTVTGPGTVSFYWQNLSDNNLDVEFDIDGNYQDDTFGSVAWYQDGPFTIPAGVHTLSWTANPLNDSDITEYANLASVSINLTPTPVITVNPFNQTNYPGYTVGLFAAAATNPSPITWQWYKAGSGAITNATNAFYSPTNSGTAGVAGFYYAVASNAGGSANTTTAVVSFVNATLPPNWSTAFKSVINPLSASKANKDFYYGAVVDASSNIYTAAEIGGGTFDVGFGPATITPGSGGDAAAILKQTPDGTALWGAALTNNGNGSSYAVCVALDPSGGIYLSGNFLGTNWLGTTQVADHGNGSIFIARFNASGSNLWIKTFGGTNSNFTFINGLVSDASGNVTATALFGSGPLSFGTTNFTVSGQQSGIFQLDSLGNTRWAQLAPGGEFLEDMVYASGRIYASCGVEVAGGTTNVNLGGLTNSTDRNWGIAALNATNGQAIWIRGVGALYGSGNGNPFSFGLLNDVPHLASVGTNLFISGVAYSSNAAFGGITVDFGDLRGEYFARYDTNGNAEAATAFGSTTTTPVAMVADVTGNVYVGGDFDTYSSFGNYLIAAPHCASFGNGYFSQSFLAKFDRNGNPLWADMAVSQSSVSILGIALAPDGVWASGWCSSTNTSNDTALHTYFGTNVVASEEQYFGLGFATWRQAGVLAKITDVETTVTLFNLVENLSNFQFSFQTLPGLTHNVEYCTNLTTPAWQTYSNFTGDGTIKTIQIPLSSFGSSKKGFVRIHP